RCGPSRSDTSSRAPPATRWWGDSRNGYHNTTRTPMAFGTRTRGVLWYPRRSAREREHSFRTAVVRSTHARPALALGLADAEVRPGVRHLHDGRLVARTSSNAVACSTSRVPLASARVAVRRLIAT